MSSLDSGAAMNSYPVVVDDNGGGTVIHWAGHVTDEVFSFLGPASAVLAQAGAKQTIVMIDEPRYRHLLPRFDTSVSIVLTPPEPDLYGRWTRARQSFVNALRNTPPSAVHLHGFIPYLLGASAIGKYARSARLYYSPHGSKSLSISSRAGVLLRRASRRIVGYGGAHDIANVSTDARALHAATGQPVTLVEGVIPQAFLDVERNESRRPLVVTGNRIPDLPSARLFAQLSVLLSEESLGISFNWIGGSDRLSESCLTAANVGIFDIVEDAERAQRLAAAWIFAAPSGKSGFPLFLAEAMAVGLPCVAIDTEYHRDLIEHGVTGYLCRNDEEMVERIAELVDSASLRARVGEAARRDASARFSPRRIRGTIDVGYRLDTDQQL